MTGLEMVYNCALELRRMQRYLPGLLLSVLMTVNNLYGQSLRLNIQEITDGLVSPVGMAAPEDGSKRLFIFEQRGRILIVENGELRKEPFLDMSKKRIVKKASLECASTLISVTIINSMSTIQHPIDIPGSIIRV